MKRSNLPVTLAHVPNAKNPEDEWWTICRDSYERLGWGYAKSKRTADSYCDPGIGRCVDTVSRRAKSEGWIKAPVHFRTPDERRLQTEKARRSRLARWSARKAAMVDELMERSFEATEAVQALLDHQRANRHVDYSDELLAMTIAMGIASDKADKCMREALRYEYGPEHEPDQSLLAQRSKEVGLVLDEVAIYEGAAS